MSQSLEFEVVISKKNSDIDKQVLAQGTTLTTQRLKPYIGSHRRKITALCLTFWHCCYIDSSRRGLFS